MKMNFETTGLAMKIDELSRQRDRPMDTRRNALNRAYESNGPNIKIRGTARHIAEKYMQLARDAHTGADPVAAENYLQHAEHYIRLIAAAQPQSQREMHPEAMDGEDIHHGLPDRFALPADSKRIIELSNRRKVAPSVSAPTRNLQPNDRSQMMIEAPGKSNK
jgi:Domain of unknown function (DUF4167)